MANFHDLFDGQNTKPVCPVVPITDAQYRLLGIEPYRRWIPTGEFKPDGSPKYAQDPELITDETGEMLRCSVKLQIVSANGLATAPEAPFVDNGHYFSESQLKALLPKVGEYVTLENARIEFKARGKRDDSFGGIETRMVFAYDDIKA